MGPEFIIQHVITKNGGWADKEAIGEDEKKGARRLPDEGLPTVKLQIIEHLTKDVHDPDSKRLLETIYHYQKVN